MIFGPHAWPEAQKAETADKIIKYSFLFWEINEVIMFYSEKDLK